MELIKFVDVVKSYKEKQVLNKISFTIDEQEIFGILGKSGSGKSTLTNILLGLVKPDSGKIYYRNKNITGNSEHLKKLVGLTTQENSFYEKLTVYENMRYYSNLYSIKPDIHAILESVNLDEAGNMLAEQLSGGMKRRLDFALSILHDPELLILDEPTTGLDPLLVEQFWRMVNSFNEKGKTIILISHHFDEVQSNCRRICILKKTQAKIVQITNKTNLLEELRDETVL